MREPSVRVAHPLPKLHDRFAPQRGIRRHRRIRELLVPVEGIVRQSDGDLDRQPVLAAVGVADARAAKEILDRVIDIVLLYAEKLERVLVDPICAVASGDPPESSTSTV